MGKTEGNVKQGNKIYIVDPNPPEMEKHRPEDMFLYIKFKADNRNRSTYLGKDETTQTDQFTNTGTQGEINFIATQVNFNADGEITPDPQQTYATTSYTNIGGIQESSSRGNLEGFGIKTIDIKYNASLVPTVDITFTDIRGAALFDVTEQNNRKSPYSIFFKMPYPIFTLSVKGYFGKTVDYCLHMINWTSNFDGTTGNFDISANFVGFQQAFLADMVLGNIIGVVNTSVGYNKLMEVYEAERRKFNKENIDNNLTLQEIGSNVPYAEVESGKKLNIRKIDDFFVRISKLQLATEGIKRDSKELEKLKLINQQLSKLKRLQQFIGTSIRKAVITKNDNESSEQFNTRKKTTSFETITNNPNIIITSDITDKVLIEGKNYLSIRDYIIFNTINRVAMERWFQTLTELIDDYAIFTTEASTEPNNPINPTAEQTFLSLYPKNHLTGDIEYQSFIDTDVTAKEDPVTLDEVFSNFQGEDTTTLNKFYVNNPNPNKGFPVGEKSPFIPAPNPPEEGVKNRMDYIQGLKLKNLVKALDFRKRRSKLQMKINELEIEAEEQYEKAENQINIELNKQLDFSPKIKDVFRILCNNTDAMLQTLADITKEAEKKSKQQRRKDALEGYITDTPPKNKNSYGWPRIHKSEINGAEEVYMGEIKELVNNYSADFPEYHFVNEVYENLVARRKKIQEINAATNYKNGLDTENWFPLNPIDYYDNPFLLMNNLNVSDELKEELIKQLLTRSCLVLNYSVFNSESGSNTITDYAKLEGINANKTIFSNTVRHMIMEVLQYEKSGYPGTEKSLIDIAKDKKIIEEKNGKYILLEGDREVTDSEGKKKELGLPTIGGYPISGYRNSTVDYIIIGQDAEPIINNGQKLWTTIQKSVPFATITLKNDKHKENVAEFYKSNFINYNYQSSLYYNVWIYPFDQYLSANDPKYTGFKIPTINTVDDNQGINYINQLYPKDTTTTANPVDYGSGLTTTTEFYKTQSDEAKAILLLSTFPFKNFEDGVLKILRTSAGQYVGARILNLPSIYLAFIGGVLYRSQYTPLPPLVPDPIVWTLFPNLKTDTKEYLWRMGVLNSGSYTGNLTASNQPIENALLNLPQQTKDNFINFFIKWVNSPNGFAELERKVINYTETPIMFNNLTALEEEERKKKDGSALVTELEKETHMVIFAPTIFDTNNLQDGLSIPIADFNKYLNDFKSTFTNANATNTKDASQAQSAKKDNKSVIQFKLQIYNYFKNINDKWVASSNGKSYNACSGQGTETSLIDYFKFLSRGWKDIGNEAVINLNSLLTLGNNLNTNMYFYISKILRDSNFLFQILPTFIDFKNPKEVQDMFKPVTVVSDSNEKRGPIYTCIYIGSSSTSLDIGDQNEYYYSNDGFTFSNNLTSSDTAKSDNIPADFNLGADEEREFALVAFRVAFGGENQGIFKSVSLSQQEHRETGEYFQALGDLVDKRGGTQRSYQGTDLLRLFKTRSYTCKVEALGCMNIQPLMYFDLQNVPFFHGAYLITSVNHNITPNHMTTSFTGLRISKYNSSPVTDVTAYLNIDLNEGNNDPPLSFTNLDITDSIYKIGVKDPEDNSWIKRISPKILMDIGVPKDIAGPLADQFLAFAAEPKIGIKSNAQAMMFLSVALTQSDYFKNKEDIWTTTPIELSGCTVYSAITNPNFGKIVPPATNKDQRKQILVKDSNGKNIPLTYKNGDKVHWVLCISSAYKNNLPEAYNIPFFGSGPGGTQEQNFLETNYGNSEAGDAYRYRPRGYIPVVGKGQYNELFAPITNNSNVVTSDPWKEYLTDPDTISSQATNALQVGALVWSKQWSDKQTNLNKALKDKSFNTFVDKNGSASMYAAVSQAQSWHSKSQADYFTVFEKVLSMFDLLDPNYPGPS